MSDLIGSLKKFQQEAQDKVFNNTGLGLSTSDVPNPGISILFFLIVTTVLLILKIVLLPSEKLDDFKNSNPVMKIIFIVYILLLFSGNYLINTSVTAELCGGTPQWGTTFIITFLPWILIFGIINIVLIIFPGWLIPFSNTFGYFVVGLFGLKDLFNNSIIIPKSKFGNVTQDEITNDKTDNKVVAKALQQIYGNESLLINEIPREGDNDTERVESFNEFFTTMQKLGIFKPQSSDTDIAKVNLYKLLKIKDYVAEYIWYLLAGILVSSITYNYIVNVGCNFSSAQMSESYNRLMAQDLGSNTGNKDDELQNVQTAQDIFMNST